METYEDLRSVYVDLCVGDRRDVDRINHYKVVYVSLFTTQADFSRAIARLILYAAKQGYQITLGDAYRDPRVTYGHPKSTHRVRLAVDLNLFREGKYLPETKDHAVLGAWWKQQHSLARWGGDFGDGNHYSFEWDGIK